MDLSSKLNHLNLQSSLIGFFKTCNIFRNDLSILVRLWRYQKPAVKRLSAWYSLVRRWGRQRWSARYSTGYCCWRYNTVHLLWIVCVTILQTPWLPEKRERDSCILCLWCSVGASSITFTPLVCILQPLVLIPSSSSDLLEPTWSQTAHHHSLFCLLRDPRPPSSSGLVDAPY